MTRQRQDQLAEMKDWLVRLELHIQADGALRHQDSLIELENFFRDLLNLTFDWKLDNANALFAVNQESFDLSDTVNHVAVQVTVTTNAAKIRKTLKGFIGKYDTTYKRLIFVYPAIEIPGSSADFGADLKGYNFVASRDRIGFGSILQKAQDMTVEKQRELLSFLRDELQPLGVALRFGVDQTLETLIAVIQFMSENSPIDQIDFDERQPDLQQKSQRFREHIDYLLGQFKFNQTLHATVEQARVAIGYDAARVAKIQAWLKSNSIEALDRNANNAQEAFRSMVSDLLKRAHAQGSNAEETAVRFLLADEFVRCNVFPNPKA